MAILVVRTYVVAVIPSGSGQQKLLCGGIMASAYISASSFNWYSFDLESNLASFFAWGIRAARSLRRWRCLAAKQY